MKNRDLRYDPVMSNTATLLKKIEELPQEQRDEVEDFIDFLASRKQRREASEDDWDSMTEEEVERRMVDEVHAYRAEQRALKARASRS